MKVTKILVVPLDRPRVKASVSIVFDDVFKVRNIKIMPRKQGKGLFVSFPETRNNSGDYLSIAYVIMIVSGVSAENLSASFGQAVAASSGTAILGWLQNLLWIIAITYPIAYFVFRGKKVPQFFGTRSKNRAIREIRDIRDNTKPY